MTSIVDRRVAELFGELMPSDKEFVIETSGSATRQPLVVNDDEFDIVKIMADSVDPDTGLLRDLRIDDRDLASAKNFYDFSLVMLKEDMKPPWMMQMWTGVMMFGEVCPCCSDKRWLNLEWLIENVDRATPSKEIKQGMKLLRHGVCPKCKRTKGDLYMNHGLRNYTELVNCLGQRSGKSSSAAFYTAYLLHRWLKFPRLADMSPSMQKSTELTGTVVGLTASRATTIWTPFTNIINDSQWFKDYDDMLMHFSKQYGIELVRKRSEYFKYFNKGIKFYFTGPRGETLRGDTRVVALIDELGLFPLPQADDDEAVDKRANADEAHKSLSNSLATVQAAQTLLLKQGLNCPPALMMGVSSPMSIRDKMMRRLADAKTDEGQKYILGVRLPTWKINPALERTSAVIALAYATNHEKAERDWGANPPIISDTYMKASQIQPVIFSQKMSHTLKYCYDQPGYIYGTVDRAYSPKYPSVVCLDAGLSNNSFSLVGAHFDTVQQKVVVTTIIEIMTHDNRKVDFNKVYLNVILPIMKDLNCVVLLADQWQSEDILSRAKQDMGTANIGGKIVPRCVTKKFSPRRANFDSLVAMIENLSMVMPFLSAEDYKDVCESQIDYKTLNGKPVKHLLLQMLTVTDGGVGRCPEKGSGFTDDIFRALVLVGLIHHEKIMERLKLAQNWLTGEGTRTGMPKPVYVSRGFA